MGTEKFNEISRLRRNAKEMETFWERFKEHTSKPGIDKHGAGFGGDNRLMEFRVNTFFYSKSGVYGNSSVSQFGRFDAKTVEPYIVRAMNKMAPELFAKASEMMKADAAKMVDEARAEVEAMSRALDDALADREIDA